MTDTPPRQPPDVLAIRWYAMPEDTIGGWCVMDTPELPSTGKGYYIADFIAGEAAARHVTDLHNAALEGPAQALADGLNAVRSAGLTLGISHDDQGYMDYVLREPGHHDGWRDIAAVTYDETEDRWVVASD